MPQCVPFSSHKLLVSLLMPHDDDDVLNWRMFFDTNVKFFKINTERERFAVRQDTINDIVCDPA